MTDDDLRAAAEKFAELDETVALGRTGQFDTAITRIRAGSGKRLMDELRRVEGDLAADTGDAVARTAATQARLSTWLLGAIMAALLCIDATGCLDCALRESKRRGPTPRDIIDLRM